MSVPNSAVEAVACRNYEAEWGDGWDGVMPSIKRGWLDEARAQCETAAPYIRANAWDLGYEAGKSDAFAADKGFTGYHVNPDRK